MTSVSDTARTYDELRAAISARHASLSRRLRQIAEFALENPNDMALETVAVIAERANVHPSSLIRFGNAFGYDGFSDMQRVFRSRLVDRLPSYSERIKSLRGAREGEFRTAEELLNHFSAAGIHTLEHLRDEIRPDSLDQAIELLARADIIYVAAQRRAFPVAAYLGYAFSHLDRRTHLLDNVGGMLAEQARAMTSQDVLLAISYTPYSPETLDLARHAQEVGSPVLAITDNPLSPLAPLATVKFEVEEAQLQAFRSLAASMCLAMTLVVGLGQRLEAGSGRRRRS